MVEPTPSLHLLSARAHRSLEVLGDRALRGTGLRAFDYEILLAIARAKRWSIASLGREIGAERSALSKRLRVLARKGLVTLFRPTIRRTRPTLTEEGLQALSRLASPWGTSEGALRAQLGQEVPVIRRSLAALTSPALGASECVAPLPEPEDRS